MSCVTISFIIFLETETFSLESSLISPFTDMSSLLFDLLFFRFDLSSLGFCVTNSSSKFPSSALAFKMFSVTFILTLTDSRLTLFSKISSPPCNLAWFSFLSTMFPVDSCVTCSWVIVPSAIPFDAIEPLSKLVRWPFFRNSPPSSFTLSFSFFFFFLRLDFFSLRCCCSNSSSIFFEIDFVNAVVTSIAFTNPFTRTKTSLDFSPPDACVTSSSPSIVSAFVETMSRSLTHCSTEFSTGPSSFNSNLFLFLFLGLLLAIESCVTKARSMSPSTVSPATDASSSTHFLTAFFATSHPLLSFRFFLCFVFFTDPFALIKTSSDFSPPDSSVTSSSLSIVSAFVETMSRSLTHCSTEFSTGPSSFNSNLFLFLFLGLLLAIESCVTKAHSTSPSTVSAATDASSSTHFLAAFFTDSHSFFLCLVFLTFGFFASSSSCTVSSTKVFSESFPSSPTHSWWTFITNRSSLISSFPSFLSLIFSAESSSSPFSLAVFLDISAKSPKSRVTIFTGTPSFLFVSFSFMFSFESILSTSSTTVLFNTILSPSTPSRATFFTNVSSLISRIFRSFSFSNPSLVHSLAVSRLTNVLTSSINISSHPSLPLSLFSTRLRGTTPSSTFSSPNSLRETTSWHSSHDFIAVSSEKFLFSSPLFPCLTFDVCSSRFCGSTSSSTFSTLISSHSL